MRQQPSLLFHHHRRPPSCHSAFTILSESIRSLFGQVHFARAMWGDIGKVAVGLGGSPEADDAKSGDAGAGEDLWGDLAAVAQTSTQAVEDEDNDPSVVEAIWGDLGDVVHAPLASDEPDHRSIVEAIWGDLSFVATNAVEPPDVEEEAVPPW